MFYIIEILYMNITIVWWAIIGMFKLSLYIQSSQLYGAILKPILLWILLISCHFRIVKNKVIRTQLCFY